MQISFRYISAFFPFLFFFCVFIFLMSEILQTSSIPLHNQQAIKAKRLTKTRNYETYIGNTIFFCGGRLLMSRAFWAFGISIVLLLAPPILFFIFT